MTTKEKINKVIKDYYRGLVSYADAEKCIQQIAPFLNSGDIGVMIDNKHF